MRRGRTQVFDDLARVLAEPVPRRTAIQMVVAAMVGLVVGGGLAPAVVVQAQPSKKPCKKAGDCVKGEDCVDCPVPSGKKICCLKNPGQVCYNVASPDCCDSDKYCLGTPSTGRTCCTAACVACSDASGNAVANRMACCPDPKKPVCSYCDAAKSIGTCCPANEHCSVCPPGGNRVTCCAANMECTKGGKCCGPPGGEVCGQDPATRTCCDAKTEICSNCGNGTSMCCDNGDTCTTCQDKAKTLKCCAIGDVCLKNLQCCAPNKVNGDTCCKGTTVAAACGGGQSALCCEPNQTCSVCKNVQKQAVGRVCCPAGTVCHTNEDGDLVCCPPAPKPKFVYLSRDELEVHLREDLFGIAGIEVISQRNAQLTIPRFAAGARWVVIGAKARTPGKTIDFELLVRSAQSDDACVNPITGLKGCKKVHTYAATVCVFVPPAEEGEVSTPGPQAGDQPSSLFIPGSQEQAPGGMDVEFNQTSVPQATLRDLTALTHGSAAPAVGYRIAGFDVGGSRNRAVTQFQPALELAVDPKYEVCFFQPSQGCQPLRPNQVGAFSITRPGIYGLTVR